MSDTAQTASWRTWIDRNLQGDWGIWFIVMALCFISVLVVYSATGTLAYKRMEGDTEYYLLRHGSLVILGLLFMWGAHKLDYRWYATLSRLALVLSVPLLIYAWKFGDTLNDASRWITIPLIQQSFQPSDLAKLALISHVALMLAKRQEKISNPYETFLPILGWCFVICVLIAMSNYSTAMLLFATCMLLMFIGRVPTKYLAMLVGVGLVGGLLAGSIGERGATFISRIEAFRESFSDPDKVPFQAQQSYIAVASGGIKGKGPGHSDQRDFLPHPYSDFIYAIIVEEYGMIGGVGVLALYLVLLYRGLVVASQTTDAFGGLLAAGLSFSLVLQALTNMAVAVGLVPITGQPLPLLSMGGTSLLFTGISLGIILSVSKGKPVTENKRSKTNGRRKAIA
ncbi:cell division protein FtsW [Catalinimonas alkaloidigena]|uniref:Probable peptidoglycan glycosyltransferase FtsW n=1 Tax=Catalinimonas alkaloidigena TaxID=1075417 RepID=A0A1G9JAD0_9BACT|nr:FtsW/RodA/SpoVE family cell cycle protein [Catalinimonas alkaloidigena]SDL34321.1 cell division protein FtsW [Catalinimonas alkaloidigena]